MKPRGEIERAACPSCRRPLGDHTLRQVAACRASYAGKAQSDGAKRAPPRTGALAFVAHVAAQTDRAVADVKTRAPWLGGLVDEAAALVQEELRGAVLARVGDFAGELAALVVGASLKKKKRALRRKR